MQVVCNKEVKLKGKKEKKKTSLFPVACAYCILTSKFVRSFFFFMMMCVFVKY